jgi:hypothetical protein
VDARVPQSPEPPEPVEERLEPPLRRRARSTWRLYPRHLALSGIAHLPAAWPLLLPGATGVGEETSLARIAGVASGALIFAATCFVTHATVLSVRSESLGAPRVPGEGRAKAKAATGVWILGAAIYGVLATFGVVMGSGAFARFVGSVTAPLAANMAVVSNVPRIYLTRPERGRAARALQEADRPASFSLFWSLLLMQASVWSHGRDATTTFVVLGAHVLFTCPFFVALDAAAHAGRKSVGDAVAEVFE